MQCVGGVAGYECTGPDTAVAAPAACSGDGGPPAHPDAGGGPDGGPAGDDAGRPTDSGWPGRDAGGGHDSGIDAPAGWTCEPSHAADEACDCGCGAVDPACETPLHVSHCDRDPCRWGDAPDLADPTRCSSDSPVADWTCDLALLDDGSACDCGCGALDPDCGPSLTPVSCDVSHCTGDEMPREDDVGECATMCGTAPADAGDATCTNGGEVRIGGSCVMSLSRCDDFHRYEVECSGGECECRIDRACVSRVRGSCGFSVSSTFRSVCGWSLVDDR